MSYMTIFEFGDYRLYLRTRIRALPKKGRGQITFLSRLLKVHSTMLTHILRGDAKLGVEHGLKITRYLGLNALETSYFVNLIHYDRAGDIESREYFRTELLTLKKRALKIGERIETGKVLDERDQAQFYSDWFGSAIRLLTAIDGFQSAHAIAAHLKLPLELVLKTADFLVRTGLCRRDGDNLSIGPQQTYVSKDSPLLPRHLANWRLKALEQILRSDAEDLQLSNPIVISRRDFIIVREKLVEFIKEFRMVCDPSPSEVLCCLNIDWIQIK
jgi:uncharacterized protein (TIGR02147 family)